MSEFPEHYFYSTEQELTEENVVEEVIKRLTYLRDDNLDPDIYTHSIQKAIDSLKDGKVDGAIYYLEYEVFQITKGDFYHYPPGSNEKKAADAEVERLHKLINHLKNSK